MTITNLHAETETPSLLEKYTDALLDFDMLQTVRDPEWMIRGYIMKGSLVCLWSDPSIGKTFVALDWGLSVCTNTTWFTHDVVPTNVLYVAGEGVSGIKKRANAWVAEHGLRPYGNQFVVLAKSVPLLEPDHAEVLLQLAREQGAGLVVIDTLARAMLGHSENDNAELGKMIAAAERIRDELDCTVLFIHHANVAAAGLKRMRGGGALKGALDAEFSLEESDDQPGLRTLTCEKQKDAEKAQPLNFFLKRSAESLVPSKFLSTQSPTNPSGF